MCVCVCVCVCVRVKLNLTPPLQVCTWLCNAAGLTAFINPFICEYYRTKKRERAGWGGNYGHFLLLSYWLSVWPGGGPTVNQLSRTDGREPEA